MTVSDTRTARNVVAEVAPAADAAPPIVRNLLPTLERGPLGRWRPARTSASNVVMVPRQHTTGVSQPDVDWFAWSLAPVTG